MPVLICIYVMWHKCLTLTIKAGSTITIPQFNVLIDESLVKESAIIQLSTGCQFPLQRIWILTAMN